jgi:peptidoglycan/LPS O-acetylase OafA/YrhL
VSAPLDGSLAVNVFFVLSGFVLTRPGWRQRDKTVVIRQILKRYVRLTPPVLATALLVALAMAWGLTQNAAAGVIVGRDDWLQPWLDFPATLPSLVGYGLWGIYWGTPKPDYDPFLWVMPFEFWGALVVLGLCWMEKRLPHLYWISAALLVFCIFNLPELACFVMGAALALLHRDGWLDAWPDRRWVNWGAVAVASAAALALASWHLPHQTPLTAALIVLVSLCTPMLRRGLAAEFSQFLGRISFPLYLMQFPVLMVVSSWAIVGAKATGRLDFGMALAIGAGSVLASIAAAVAFMPVERATLALSRAVGRLVQPVAPQQAERLPARPTMRHAAAAHKKGAGTMAGQSGGRMRSSSGRG